MTKTETSKCSYVNNRKTGEQCGQMTVAKLRIGRSDLSIHVSIRVPLYVCSAIYSLTV